jgi:primary-amine oxidase
VRAWADRKDNVKDDDIVVWIQFGINHVPRIEDFPVMPVEILKVMLKPANFFERKYIHSARTAEHHADII